jgi:hypothetical protein
MDQEAETEIKIGAGLTVEVEMERETTEAEDAEADEAAVFDQLKAWWKDDWEHHEKWAEEAREDFDFAAGKQWTDEQMRVLEEQGRPPSVFNRVGPVIDSICGFEVGNRNEIRFFPRKLGDSGLNEMLTAAGDWFRDQSGAEYEESDAFRDAVICGRGVTETRVDFTVNPDGDPRVERIDPLECFPDKDARKPNYGDARRVWRIKQIPLDEAKALFPDVDETQLHASWAAGEAHGDSVKQSGGGLDYNTDDEGNRDDDLCTIIECQWYDIEPFVRFVDGATGEEVIIPKKEFDRLMDRISAMPVEMMLQLGIAPPMGYIEQKQRVYKRAFIGKVLLEAVKPTPTDGAFSYQFITGKRDQNKGHFYGMVRAVKDPQRWTNKLFSQVMHILNSSAKGGIMAERGAFEDDRQAMDSWAKADGITWLSQGALQKGMIQPKPQTGLPPGQAEMLQFAMSAMPLVTGVNMEMLGMKETQQAGVLEYQRRQAGVTILAPLFDSLRRYRVVQGKIMLHMIQNYLADDRLIRIVEKDQVRYLPLNRDMIMGEYDVIVDEAPSSPNAKDRNFAIIQSLWPMLQGAMTPQIAAEIVTYSPLPESLAAKISEQLLTPPGPPPPDPKVIELQAKAVEADKQRMFEITKMREEFALKAQMEADNRALNLQMEAAKLQRQMEIEVAQGEADMAVERYKANLQAAVNEQKINLERELKIMELQWREREKAQEALTGTARQDMTAEGQRMIAEALANGNAMLARAVESLGANQAMQAQTIGQVAANIAAPRQTRVIRDPATNQIVGAEQI